MKTEKPTRVRITRQDMRTGEAGNCFRCAVARAMQRATGDDEANVLEDNWTTMLEVWGREIVAPAEVARFVWEYDSLDRREDGTVILPDPLPDELKPLTFDLPPSTDPEWEERCSECEELFDPKELDDEGFCPECHKEANEQ